MDVLTDLFPLETSWELTDARGTTVIDSREAGFYTVPSQLYREAICVPASGELALIVYDSKDDGMCCGVREEIESEIDQGISCFCH